MATHLLWVWLGFWICWCRWSVVSCSRFVDGNLLMVFVGLWVLLIPLFCLLQTSYFVYPRFGCQTPKMPKILSFLHGATETSILTWHNPFRHQSTRNAISSQIDQNAPSQPWVDQKSKLCQNHPKKTFSCFYIKPELLDDFHQRWPSLIQGWLSRTPETLILIWPLEQVGSSSIVKNIKFSFHQLFMGRNWS